MGIRANKNQKDHLRIASLPPQLTLVEEVNESLESVDPLRFFTKHPSKPCLVDLNVFSSGEFKNPRKTGGGTWSGAFNGRPELILEMSAAIRDRMMPLAEKSVTAYLSSLRRWWRLLDNVEAQAPSMQPVASTAQLTEVHRQRAFDTGMRRLIFSNFISLANTTRAAMDLRQLFWQPPEDKTPTRHLAPTWQTDIIRHALKHRWFEVVDRWSLADSLREESLDKSSTRTLEMLRLKKNYVHYDEVAKRTKNPRPSMTDLAAEFGNLQKFYLSGLNVIDMIRGTYPDGDDIRAAFHLCLAATGWNPAVLLNLNINDTFIEPHPKDPMRYILRSTKARAGGTEQTHEGLFKTQSGAGFVIQTLVARSLPLRTALRAELTDCTERLRKLGTGDAAEVTLLRQRITSLERGVSSVWLYASITSTGIQRLEDNTFATHQVGDKHRFLDVFIAGLNKKQPADLQLASLNASDLRDVHAARAYRASGGSILAVMKALGHRTLRSTASYLSNTLLKEEHRKLFSTFSGALWEQMETGKRVDPTIIAKISRDGFATLDERARLTDYRHLMTTRMGTKCADPLHPPRHIAPSFNPDGKSFCPVQRCTLCLENAILTPSSVPGLCKRRCELRFLRAHMSVGAFEESSFPEELDNTELALLAFDEAEVQHHTAIWEEKIATGKHRVTEFDGEP